MSEPIRTNIPFRGVDLQPLQRQRADGICEDINNLRPTGLEDRPRWEPVGLPDEPVLSGVLRAHWYIRAARGDLSTDPSGSLKRLVVLKNNAIVLVDPEQSYAVTNSYSLPGNANREATFSQIEDILVISTSIGDIPEKTFLLIDDTFVPFGVIALPKFRAAWETLTLTDPEDENQGLDRGFWYALRIAWRFKDGNTTAYSLPVLIDLVNRDVDATPPQRKRYKLILTYDDAFKQSPAWEYLQRILDGIGIGIASGETASDALDAVYYDAGTMAFDEISFEVNRRRESLFTLPVVDESNLVGIHDVTASTAGSYNKRLLIGNTAIDYAEPAQYIDPYLKAINLGETVLSPAINMRLVVGIETGGNTIIRVSPTFPMNTRLKAYRLQSDNPNANPVTGEPGDTQRSSAIFGYPDRRAKWAELWGEYGGVWYKIPFTYVDAPTNTLVTINRIDLVAGKSSNYAVTPHFVGFWDIKQTAPAQTGGALPSLDNNERYDHVRTRIFASSPYNPFHIPARQTYFAQAGAEDPVVAFASNTQPISSGQFGQFPLYVFTRNTITALEQVADSAIAFGRTSPLSTRMGANGYHSVVNAGRSVFFLSTDGLHQLPSELNQPISLPVNEDILDRINTLSIAYHQRGEIRELWLGAPTGKSWCFSLKHGRWFSQTMVRNRWFSDGTDLFGITTAGAIVKEDSTAGTVTVSIKTGDMNFGEPDLLKRISNIIIKWKASAAQVPVVQLFSGESPLLPANYRSNHLRSKYGAMLEYKLHINGELEPGDWIESFDISFQPRYDHRRI